MAVSIRLSSTDPWIEPGKPMALFGTRLASGSDNRYLVSADGERFLMNTVVGDSSSAPITMILWKPKK